MKTNSKGASQAETPAIWVGDLGDYNAGILTGEWIVIEEYTTLEEIQQQIHAILQSGVSEDSAHEEWIICDYENLPLSGEYTGLETILEVAQWVHQYGYDIVKAYIDIFGTKAFDEFEERYCGVYDSIEDYAYELVNDCYNLKSLMGELVNYFDYDSYAHDLECSGDVTAVRLNYRQVVIFRAY